MHPTRRTDPKRTAASPSRRAGGSCTTPCRMSVECSISGRAIWRPAPDGGSPVSRAMRMPPPLPLVMSCYSKHRSVVRTWPACWPTVARRRPWRVLPPRRPRGDPTGRYIGLTYGNWRRVVDDVGYPDIGQDVGIIAVDWETTATEPARIVEASESEDQSMFWSPNGKWIAFHSHQQLSDDLWIQPADGSAPIRRITHLGRGAEAGWPRWSPDGRWIVFPALKLVDGARRKVLLPCRRRSEHRPGDPA